MKYRVATANYITYTRIYDTLSHNLLHAAIYYIQWRSLFSFFGARFEEPQRSFVTEIINFKYTFIYHISIVKPSGFGGLEVSC